MTDLAIVPALESQIGEPTKQQRPVQGPLGPEEVLSTCRWCWGQHPGACPYIKVVEWHPNGQVSRVVLKERTEHEDKILYPGDEETT